MRFLCSGPGSGLAQNRGMANYYNKSGIYYKFGKKGLFLFCFVIQSIFNGQRQEPPNYYNKPSNYYKNPHGAFFFDRIGASMKTNKKRMRAVGQIILKPR